MSFDKPWEHPEDPIIAARPSATHPGGTVYFYAKHPPVVVHGGGGAAYRANSPGLNVPRGKEDRDDSYYARVEEMVRRYAPVGAVGYTESSQGKPPARGCRRRGSWRASTRVSGTPRPRPRPMASPTTWSARSTQWRRSTASLPSTETTMPLPPAIRNSQARLAKLRRIAGDARAGERQRVVARHLIASQRAALKLRARSLFHAAKGKLAPPG